MIDKTSGCSETVQTFNYGLSIIFWMIFWPSFGWLFFFVLDFPELDLSHILLSPYGFFATFVQAGILVVISLITFGLLGGIILGNKCRTYGGWAILGMAYWPSVGLIYILVEGTQALEIFYQFYPLSLYWYDLIGGKGEIYTLIISALLGATIGGLGGFFGDKLLRSVKKTYRYDARSALQGFIIGLLLILSPIIFIVFLLQLISYGVYGDSLFFPGMFRIAFNALVAAAGVGGLIGFLIVGNIGSKKVKELQ